MCWTDLQVQVCQSSSPTIQCTFLFPFAPKKKKSKVNCWEKSYQRILCVSLYQMSIMRKKKICIRYLIIQKISVSSFLVTFLSLQTLPKSLQLLCGFNFLPNSRVLRYERLRLPTFQFIVQIGSLFPQFCALSSSV